MEIEQMPNNLGMQAPTPELKPAEFARLKEFAYTTFGLSLPEGKERLVAARLGRHLRARGFRSYSEYLRFVQADRSGEALTEIIDSLTTNHTSFLRERQHLDFLTQKVVKQNPGWNPMRIWCAASSTGEEPYSIAFSLAEAQAIHRNLDFHILATDISTRVLRVAGQAVYGLDRVQQLPPDWVPKYFDRSVNDGVPSFRVKAYVRSRITFKRLNLMQTLDVGVPYHAIFCRNVMIYFDQKTQASLVQRIAANLVPGGYLFVGHAESLAGVQHGLTYVCPAVYRKG